MLIIKELEQHYGVNLFRTPLSPYFLGTQCIDMQGYFHRPWFKERTSAIGLVYNHFYTPIDVQTLSSYMRKLINQIIEFPIKTETVILYDFPKSALVLFLHCLQTIKNSGLYEDFFNSISHIALQLQPIDFYPTEKQLAKNELLQGLQSLLINFPKLTSLSVEGIVLIEQAQANEIAFLGQVENHKALTNLYLEINGCNTELDLLLVSVVQNSQMLRTVEGIPGRIKAMLHPVSIQRDSETAAARCATEATRILDLKAPPRSISPFLDDNR